MTGAAVAEELVGAHLKRVAWAWGPALDASSILRWSGLNPDAWQKRVLATAKKRTLILCSRQIGKSTVVAARALHAALFSPGSLVLIFAPSQKQAAELFRKIMGFYNPFRDAFPVVSETVLKAEWKNGSRIVSLPADPATVRGFSNPALVILDEAAFCQDALYAAVRPMLALGGDLICLSSAWEKRGWFYNEFTVGGAEWERITVPVTECPRHPASFLEEERRSLGELIFRREYMCEFIDAAESAGNPRVLDSKTIASAFDSDVAPL